jgi:hypothetical protein
MVSVPVVSSSRWISPTTLTALALIISTRELTKPKHSVTGGLDLGVVPDQSQRNKRLL